MAMACARLDPSTRPVAGPSSDVSAAEPDGSAFVPAHEIRNGRAHLPLTFPDGTQATIVYPAELDLAAMGVQPDVDFVWDDHWIGAFVFAHGPRYESFLAGKEPVATHRSPSGGDVEEWLAAPRLKGRGQSTERWLLYTLPSWTVLVPLSPRSPAAEVLKAIRVTETPDGFPTVDARAPGELPRGAGEGGGSQLGFGDAHPSADTVGGDHDLVVAPFSCDEPGREISLGGTFGSACLADSLVVRIQVLRGTAEEKEFLEALIRNVETEA